MLKNSYYLDLDILKLLAAYFLNFDLESIELGFFMS